MSLVTSIFLYDSETRTLLADSEKDRIQVFETKCLRKLLCISYLELGAQDQRLGTEQDQLLCGPQEPLLAIVARRKLAWFEHVTRHDSLSKSPIPI